MSRDEWCAAYVLQFGWGALNCPIQDGEWHFIQAMSKDLGISLDMAFRLLHETKWRVQREEAPVHPQLES